MRYFVTGGAGFIGSVLIGYLNQKKIYNITIVDHIGIDEKWKNLVNKKFDDYIDRNVFFDLIQQDGYLNKEDIIIHLGACSSTTEGDTNYLMNNNTKYSKTIFDICKKVGTRLIYASSAATYGNGELGYSDNEFDLSPLNMYGYSKHLFDQWVINDSNNFNRTSSQIVGLKFFNVYGPNEYHKSSMASMVYHGFKQIIEQKTIGLFKSYKENIKDGEQKRDFIYVKDIVKVIYFFVENTQISGIYNLGTGVARTFNDLINTIFLSLGLKPNIYYKDMPEGMIDKYQYFTEANISKLREIGHTEDFFSLEEGVRDYVLEYLNKGYKPY